FLIAEDCGTFPLAERFSELDTTSNNPGCICGDSAERARQRRHLARQRDCRYLDGDLADRADGDTHLSAAVLDCLPGRNAARRLVDGRGLAAGSGHGCLLSEIR